MGIQVFELVEPTESNGYCAFVPELEGDENVFFHMTKASNVDAIVDGGFLSANDLGIGNLHSVSYAKRSSSCFANLGCELEHAYAIFAVRFEDDTLSEITINASDIHVYKKHLQPEILGVVYLPSGFRVE